MDECLSILTTPGFFSKRQKCGAIQNVFSKKLVEYRNERTTFLYCMTLTRDVKRLIILKLLGIQKQEEFLKYVKIINVVSYELLSGIRMLNTDKDIIIRMALHNFGQINKFDNMFYL